MTTASDTLATSPSRRGGVADDTLVALANMNRMRASPKNSPLSDRGISPGRSFRVESPIKEVRDEGRSFFVPDSPHRARTQSPYSEHSPVRSPRRTPVRSPLPSPRRTPIRQVHSEIPHVSERRYDKDTMLAYLARHNHKSFTIVTPYEEVRAAYIGVHDTVMLNNAKENMRKLLLSIIRLIEWGNGRFDPFGMDLDGWTEQSYTTIDAYDVPLEQLYEQYKGKFKMSPWGQLFMIMGLSAFWFNFTKNFTNTTGGNSVGGGNMMNTMMKIMMNPPPGANPLSGVPTESQPPPQRAPSMPSAPHVAPSPTVPSSPREAAASSEPPQLPPDIASMMSGMLNSPFMANLMRQAQ